MWSIWDSSWQSLDLNDKNGHTVDEVGQVTVQQKKTQILEVVATSVPLRLTLTKCTNIVFVVDIVFQLHTLMYHHHITVNVNNNFLSSPPFWHFSSIPTLHNHLMVTHTDFLWMHYDFLSSPPFWHFSSILTFGQTPQKWPILAPKKVNVRPAEKSHSPNPYWYGLFAKNRVQIGQIWPLWPNIHFTGPYRGSPPCTLSQHPNSRETGYSNVELKGCPKASQPMPPCFTLGVNCGSSGGHLWGNLLGFTWGVI